MFVEKIPLNFSILFMIKRYFIDCNKECHFENKNGKEILFNNQALCLVCSLVVFILKSAFKTILVFQKELL